MITTLNLLLSCHEKFYVAPGLTFNLVTILKFPPPLKIIAAAMPVDKEKDGEIFIYIFERSFRKLDLSRGFNRNMKWIKYSSYET